MQSVLSASAPPRAEAGVHVPVRAAWRLGTRVLDRPASWAALGLGLFAASWEVLPRAGLVDPLFLPALSTVLASLVAGVRHGQLVANVAASLGRAIPGLALAIVAGIPAGLALGAWRRLRQVVEPVLEVFRNTSALALLPVFTLLLGIGETSKIAMVFYAAFWPILLATVSGIAGVDPLWLKAGRSMGLSPAGLFVHIALPAAAPTIFTGIRLATAAALLVLVAAEMVGSRAGLGYLINASQLDFDIPGMYAAILVLSVIGTLTNLALVRVERRLLRWRHV